MTDRGETGDPGRKGDTGRVGDPGRTGDQGDTGRGPRGYRGEAGTTGTTGAQGVQGVPGVSLTVEQLESYVRRLEGRYQRVVIRLTVALVVVSVAVLGTLAWAADGLRDRLDGQQENRRAANVGVCEAINETNRGIVDFLEEVSTPERVKLGMETFSERDCPAEVRRLTPRSP